MELACERLELGMYGRGMGQSHFLIEPSVYKLLQAGLSAQMLGGSIVRQQCLPGINLEHVAFRRVWMRAKRLIPCQPPVVSIAFLFAANIAIKGFCPGHWEFLRCELDRLPQGIRQRAVNATFTLCFSI
jgi:hypothetical protein